MSKISYYDAEETGGGTSDSFLSYESEYTYNMHGNVTGEKDYEVDGQMRSLLQAEVTGGIQTSYAHNGFNQLTSAIERDGEEVLSDISYLYDANGNRTQESDRISGETILMEYNAFDMMSRYEKKESTDTVFLQENRYDGSGKRVEKKEIRQKENEAQPETVQLERVTKRYTYQGDTVLQTDVSKVDVTGFGGTPLAGASADDTECFDLLTPGGNIISTSRKRSESGSSSENWYTFNTDYNGSTTSIISHTGAAVSTYEYDDYGTISAVTDDIDNEVCYTGQIYDEGTGLYYYNARYYDSEGASFTSMDTYRGNNMLPLTLNLYMYCGGDPVNYTDPSGHGFLKLFKKLVKAATKSSSRKASRKTTTKSTHRASATVRRKAVVKRVDSAAKKVKQDMAMQITSIANVIDAGRKGKKRTYSRTVELSAAALLGVSMEVGYAVTSKRQVGLTASISTNGAYGFGYGAGIGGKYWNAKGGAMTGVNYTMVYKLW